jgi:hypothetical protein
MLNDSATNGTTRQSSLPDPGFDIRRY